MRGSSAETVENNGVEPGDAASGNPHHVLQTALVESSMESSKIREAALETN